MEMYFNIIIHANDVRSLFINTKAGGGLASLAGNWEPPSCGAREPPSCLEAMEPLSVGLGSHRLVWKPGATVCGVINKNEKH